MKAMVVHSPGKPFTQEEREVQQLRPGEVRIRVHACGICRSDELVTAGLWPGLEYPRVPGHEVAGVVDAIGDGVNRLAVGARVGVGWHGGHDGTCDACLSGKFQRCQNARITGISTDGGYAEYMIAPAIACARIPDGMEFDQAAPLLCAGITSFNALRNSGARSGDLVGVQGLGGLGHLAIQYARAMGFEVAAISQGQEKEQFAHRLGAHHYVDTKTESAAARLTAFGGAKAILATAPDAASVSALVEGLGTDGSLIVVGVPSEPLKIEAQALISGYRRVLGWSSGTAVDSTDAMAFAQQQGIEAMIETFSLDQTSTAFERMMQGKVRFKAVLQLARG